jgi:hypothetical protein
MSTITKRYRVLSRSDGQATYKCINTEDGVWAELLIVHSDGSMWRHVVGGPEVPIEPTEQRVKAPVAAPVTASVPVSSRSPRQPFLSPQRPP